MPVAGAIHSGLTQRARHGEPLPAQSHTDERASSRKDLRSWWKGFAKGQRKDEDKAAASLGIFGIPLQTSVRYANVAISLQDADGNSYVYGYVPIVVAKCGVFLKEKATDVEGIFRLSGSEKRIKELKEAFNSPDRYGKGLDWTGYTVHDAANILRRYFNQLPEPIIPLEFYEQFREPLKGHQAHAVGAMDHQEPSFGVFDPDKTIRVYQNLITELPPLNRQLLLYILDLLAVFASKSDLNKMTTPNLAAIFQPGLLSHPQHDMSPGEYRLSQDVLIFLIENQDHFLIGMPGTRADEQTKADVESGPPTPSVAKKNILARTGSTASRYSGVRRSVSVSSRQSGSVPIASPTSPGAHTPTASSVGVHRSNTVPSKRSPRTSSIRFQRDQPSDPTSPQDQTPMYTPAESPTAISGPDMHSNIIDKAFYSAQLSGPADADVSVPTLPHQESPMVHSPLLADQARKTGHSPFDQIRGTYSEVSDTTQSRSVSGNSEQNTPVNSRLAAFFGGKPATLAYPSSESVERRKPNKLKKRIPGSDNPSAQSSVHSLHEPHSNNTEQMPMPTAAAGSSTTDTASTYATGHSSVQNAPTKAAFLSPLQLDSIPLKPPTPVGLKDPPMSPAFSYRSHSEFTEGELDDVQPLDHQGPVDIKSESEDGGKRHRFWKRGKGDAALYSPSHNEAQQSRTSILSGGGDGYNRPSLTLDRNATLSDPDSDAPRDSNPLLWIKGKLERRAERREEKERMKEEKERIKEEKERIQEERDRRREKRKLELARPPDPPMSQDQIRFNSVNAAAAAVSRSGDAQFAGFTSAPPAITNLTPLPHPLAQDVPELAPELAQTSTTPTPKPNVDPLPTPDLAGVAASLAAARSPRLPSRSSSTHTTTSVSDSTSNIIRAALRAAEQAEQPTVAKSPADASSLKRQPSRSSLTAAVLAGSSVSPATQAQVRERSHSASATAANMAASRAGSGTFREVGGPASGPAMAGQKEHSSAPRKTTLLEVGEQAGRGNGEGASQGARTAALRAVGRAPDAGAGRGEEGR